MSGAVRTEEPLQRLLRIMRELRDPDTGCEWDIAQTFATIAPYTIEEAYEVADAIARDDLDDLRDELGDLLLQVVFHAQMASEQSVFDFDAVATAIANKMERRHPHVFGNVVHGNDEERSRAWEAAKAAERLDRQASRQAAPVTPSALDDVARALPALIRAEKLQRRAAGVGFDWPEAAPVWDKLQEEITESHEAIASGDTDAIEDELGDLLFTVVNLARHHQVAPEAALTRANAKFATRFRHVEQLAREAGCSLHTCDLPTLDAFWNQAKDL